MWFARADAERLVNRRRGSRRPRRPHRDRAAEGGGYPVSRVRTRARPARERTVSVSTRRPHRDRAAEGGGYPVSRVRTCARARPARERTVSTSQEGLRGRECHRGSAAPPPQHLSPPSTAPPPGARTHSSFLSRAHGGLVSGRPTKEGSTVHRRGTEPTWDHGHGRRSVTSWTTSRHGRPGDPDRTAACGETVMWIMRSSRIHAIRPSASSRSSVY